MSHMKKYTNCHICGKEIVYKEDEVIPSYCGNACYDRDMKQQIKKKGYFLPFISLQVSKIFPIK